MKKIIVKPNQTVYDIAVTEYGTCEAVAEIIANNPELANDERAKVSRGIDPVNDKSFYFDLSLKPGSTVLVDTDSRLINKNIVREINKEITTFDLKEDYGTDNQ